MRGCLCCVFYERDWLVEFHVLEELDAGVDVFVHDLVDVDEVDAFAVVGDEFFNEGAALEAFLMAEVEGLSCIEEFDGHDAFGVFHNLIAFCCSVATHADEVFLVLAGGDAVYAAGGAELFALADDGSSCILGDHEAAVETWLGDEEAGEAAFGIDELVGAAFADAAEFGDGDGEEVKHHGHGFAVEVSAGDDHILVREDDGVVGGGVDFGFDYRSDVCDGVFGGAMDLRSAAEAIGVLDVFFVAGDDLAAFGVATDSGGSFELAFVGTNHVEAFEEGFDAAVEGIEAEREKHVGLTAETLGFENAPDSVVTHELGAVEKGEAFLALEFDGLPAKLVVDFFDVAAATFPIDVAEAKDSREHEVGQGAEVAAGTEAALLIDNGEDIVVVAVDKTLYGLELCSAIAEAEVLGFEKEHETNDLSGDFVANAAGVAHDEVFLQLAELFLADGDVAEGAEAGGDTIDGHFLGFHFFVEVVAAFLDAAFGFVAKSEGLVAFDDFAYFGDGEAFFGIDIMGHDNNSLIR